MRARSTSCRAPIAAVIAVAVLSAACGGGTDDATGCVEVREPEDPASSLHVITSEGFTYQTDPPTSGPHVGGHPPTGVLSAPLAAPVQVAVLEGGGVMIQFDPQSQTDEALITIAGDAVVVAPGIDLPARIVATAWTWKLTCPDVSLPRLERFVAERSADAPGRD